MRRKLLALLLAAAMAITLLAACGSGQQSAARVLLNLLDGKYANVSVEIDPDLEADLRQVLSENENDDQAAIRAALEKVLGSTVTFTRLGKGQQGDTTFDLVFYAGSDSDKAAQTAYTTWNPIFSTLPKDGKYTAGLTMVETDNGIWMLVQATVDKAGTEDKPQPATVTGISISAQPSTIYYNKGESFDPAGMEITVTYSDGSKKTISGITTSDKKGVDWSPATINDNPTTVTVTYGGKNATVEVKLITLESIEVSGPAQTEYVVGLETFSSRGIWVTACYSNGTRKKVTDYTFAIAKEDGSSIDPSDPFDTVGEYTLTVEWQGVKSSDIPITVIEDPGYIFDYDSRNYIITSSDGLQNLFNSLDGSISSTVILEGGKEYTVDTTKGFLADSFSGTLTAEGGKAKITLSGSHPLFDYLNGSIQNVEVTMTGTINSGAYTRDDIGTLASSNYGSIIDCDVIINGTLLNESGKVGGIAGENHKTIRGCTVTIHGSIKGSSDTAGIAGGNYGTIESCRVSGNPIEGSGKSYVGGIAGGNNGTIKSCSAAVDVKNGGETGGVAGESYRKIIACYHTGTVTGSGSGEGTGGVVGLITNGSVDACYHTGTVTGSGSGDTTGGVVGTIVKGSANACYWSGSPDKGIGTGSGEATQVTGGNWTDATKAMNEACGNLYDATSTDAPKLNWEK